MVTAKELKKQVQPTLQAAVNTTFIENISLSSSTKNNTLSAKFNKLVLFQGVDEQGKKIIKPDYNRQEMAIKKLVEKDLPKDISVKVEITPRKYYYGLIPWNSREVEGSIQGIKNLRTQVANCKLTFSGNIEKLTGQKIFTLCTKSSVHNADTQGKPFAFTVADSKRHGIIQRKYSIGASTLDNAPKADLLLNRPKAPVVGFGIISGIIRGFAAIVNLIAKPFQKNKEETFWSITKTTVVDPAKKEETRKQEYKEKIKTKEVKQDIKEEQEAKEESFLKRMKNKKALREQVKATREGSYSAGERKRRERQDNSHAIGN